MIAITDGQQRVIDEKNALDEKLIKLSAFVRTDEFYALDTEDRQLLRRQREVMLQYSDILGDRIARFAP